MARRLEWVNATGADAAAMAESSGRRVVWADDGYMPYAAELPDGWTVRAALEDFASGYSYESMRQAVKRHRTYRPAEGCPASPMWTVPERWDREAADDQA